MLYLSKVMIIHYFDRCCYVFFPSKMNEPIFQIGSKLTPLLGWAIAMSMFAPTLMSSYGQFSLECRSRICRWIGIDSEGNPTYYDPEVHGHRAVMAVACIILVLNVTTYVKVSVKRWIIITSFKLRSLIKPWDFKSNSI